MRSVLSPEIRWLGRQVLPLMRLNLLGLVSIVAASVLTLLTPLIMKWLIDEALAKRTVGLLLLGATGFGAAYFGQLAFSYAAYLVGFIVSQKMIFRIRVALIRPPRNFSSAPRLISAGAPHESTSPASNLARASVRTLVLCLPLLRMLYGGALQTSLRCRPTI